MLTKIRQRRAAGKKRIRRWKLKDEETKEKFRRNRVERLSNIYDATTEHVEQWWEEIAEHVLTEDVRKDVPGLMMFADDIVLCGDDETDTTEYLETRRRALEDKGMMISRPNTQFIDFQFGEDNVQGRGPVKILGEELQMVHHLMYLGSSLEETGGMTT